MRGSRFWFSIILFLAAATAVSAQPFQILLQQGETTSLTSNGSTVGIGADAVGQPITTKVIIVYRGTGVATVQTPQLIGSTTFTLASLPAFPVNLSPGASLSFDLQFAPTASTNATTVLTLAYSEVITFAGPPSSTQTSTGTLSLAMVGGAPEIAVSYFLPSDGNVIALPTGSTLNVPDTTVGTTTTMTIVIANRGTAAAKVNSVSVTGFPVVGLPLFPASISAGTDVRFGIQYTPKQIETVTGALHVSMDSGSIDITLRATAIGPQLVYDEVLNGVTTRISPNDSISLPDTAVGETLTFTVQARNAGSEDATISAVEVTGTAFRLSDSPPVPRVLSTNGTFVATIAFTPTQPGIAHGRLRIGNDLFDLVANGIGTRFLYSYTAGTSTVSVLTGGTVFFSPVQAGRSTQTTFAIQNTGTSGATISSIGIIEAGAFALTGLPALPVTLPPNQSLRFTITFAPLSVGFSGATLRVDAQSFPLSGSATAPPNLPDFRLTGPTGSVGPLQQPTVSLTLLATYPVAVSGKLAITIDSQGLIVDPAVQFSTGGRTVTFTIPANTTRAIFANDSTQVGVQTGSVAGTITITPSFSLAGGADLTPSSVATLQFSIPAAAPTLLSVQVGSRSATQLVLIVTGITTTRSLSQVDIEFTPISGISFSNPKVSINMGGAATSWFSSAAAQPFGGQFTLSLPFTFQSGQTSPVDSIASVSVTVSSDRGASNSVSLGLH